MQPGQFIKPIIVGIAGISASGKTRTAHALADLLNASAPTGKPCAIVVSHDNFYRALRPGEDGLTHDWDAPDAYDAEEFVDRVTKWQQGKSTWIPCHDFSTYTRIEKARYIEIDPTIQQVVIIEGIHVLDEQYVTLYDIRLFVSCDCDIALMRRITRDMSERGYPLETVLFRYGKYVRPALMKWILPSQKNAQLVIPNNGDDNETESKIESAYLMIECLWYVDGDDDASN